MRDGAGRRRGRRLALLALGATVAMVVAAVLALVPRDDEVGEIDAVMVLGGGGIERLELGSALARERDVPLVLSAEGITQGARAGLTCDLDVLCVHPAPSTTAGEARAMRALAAERGWKRVGVATSSFHVNRSRLLFRQCFDDDADVIGADVDGSTAGDLYRYSRELLGQLVGATVRRAC